VDQNLCYVIHIRVLCDPQLDGLPEGELHKLSVRVGE